MAVDVGNDLANFHQFVGQQLAGREAQLSPEQELAMWRVRRETITSVRRGLDDVDAGRTKPADQVLRKLREETPDS